MKKGFIFYRSFYDAIKYLPADEFKKCVCAILDYGLDGMQPEETDTIAFTVYQMAKPQIDANQRRYENGCKGGRPKKPRPNQTEPSENQDEPKEKDKDKEKQKGKDLDLLPPSTKPNRFINFVNDSYGDVTDLERKLVQ